MSQIGQKARFRVSFLHSLDSVLIPFPSSLDAPTLMLSLSYISPNTLHSAVQNRWFRVFFLNLTPHRSQSCCPCSTPRRPRSTCHRRTDSRLATLEHSGEHRKCTEHRFINSFPHWSQVMTRSRLSSGVRLVNLPLMPAPPERSHTIQIVDLQTQRSSRRSLAHLPRCR